MLASPMSSRPTRIGRSPLGLLLAVLALAGQLALGTVVLPEDTEAAALGAANILCQTGAPEQPPAAPQHRRAPDGALCPLAAALAMPGAILTPAPLLPLPLTAGVRMAAVTPRPRAPPARPLRISLARAPPTRL